MLMTNNAGDLNQLSMDQTRDVDNRSNYKVIFHMVTHVFYNSNLSQETFTIDINILFGTWSQTYACDPSDYMETRL